MQIYLNDRLIEQLSKMWIKLRDALLTALNDLKWHYSKMLTQLQLQGIELEINMSVSSGLKCYLHRASTSWNYSLKTSKHFLLCLILE